jgi:hypothetical protein
VIAVEAPAHCRVVRLADIEEPVALWMQVCVKTQLVLPQLVALMVQVGPVNVD